MSILSHLSAYGRFRRTQWLDRGALRALQEAKLQRLVQHAYRTVPFYRRRFDAAGVSPDAIRRAEDLERLPVITKAELQAAGLDATVSTAVPPEALTCEHTSGSTGRPFTVRFDPGFVAARNALFLRVLTTAGYRFGDKLLLVTSDRHKQARTLLRWRYASIQDAAEELVEVLNAFRPAVLYGCLTPLRQMARAIDAGCALAHRPKCVVSTAESLDQPTRALLEEAFRAPVFDAYGLTESGMLAWQCQERDGYHLSEDAAVVEFLPAADDAARRLVVTNLELLAMPLIRFETGDLVAPGSAERCACGRALARIARVEGRLVDGVRRRDGRVVSPYRCTLALEAIPGIRRYQLIQEDVGRYTLRVETPANGQDIAAQARRAIGKAIGEEIELRLQPEASLDPPPGRKFRVVESRLMNAKECVA